MCSDDAGADAVQRIGDLGKALGEDVVELEQALSGILQHARSLRGDMQIAGGAGMLAMGAGVGSGRPR